MKKLYCLLVGHDLKVTKHITNHIKEYQCTCCKEKFTTSPTGQITILTDTREEANTVLKHIHTRRLERKGFNYSV
ncbi:MAG: hypothetical protein ACON5F_08585 [Jejuia sp.]